jgi:peptide/nickel transport system ATP-binding protein
MLIADVNKVCDRAQQSKERSCVPYSRSPSDGVSQPLLEIRGLVTEFKTEAGVVRAVDEVDLHINRGETLCVVGESGSGKSVTALSIMRLVRAPAGRIVKGEIHYEGTDLLKLSTPNMMKIRGKEIAMIFQDPMSSLNPVLTIGEQIEEMVQLHEKLSKRDARDRAIEMLRIVQIPSPERRVKEYPHLMSGGMRQRVMIAMALCCKPKLLIADEPTTALDVTIQAQILALLEDLKQRFNMAILLITHDMGVVAETAQRVAVMYGARVVEEAPVDQLFSDPLHPYTRGLLRSIPRVDRTVGAKRRLEQIPGMVPTLRAPILPGCRFAPRCQSAQPMHFSRTPELKEVGPARKVACFLYD